MEIAQQCQTIFSCYAPSQFYKDVLELGELAKLGKSYKLDWSSATFLLGRYLRFYVSEQNI